MDGCQEVVGSRSEAVLNQRTDDHILEMFSTGLMSRESRGLEPDACRGSFQLRFRTQGGRAAALGEAGRRSWSVLPTRLLFSKHLKVQVAR